MIYANSIGICGSSVVKIAFIGLGKMGFPIAGHLVRSGHDVVAYNRSPAKLAAWLAAYSGDGAVTPVAAVADAELVFFCVTDAAAARAVLLGNDGALSRMRRGAVLIDHSSATPESARELSAVAAERGVHFLDAPVTGGTVGAIAGTLGVMVGGDPATFARVEPAMRCYARTISLMGPVGSGHLAKLVNVVCAVGMSQALAEGLAFAKRAGLDMDGLIAVLMAGSTRSYLLEHKGPAMVAGTHLPAGFTVDLVRKDIGQALGEAARLEAKLPLLAMVDGFYADIQARGGGGWDTSSLIALLE
jgi:3-hydroxyisobutyrate dehydrogenase-like beta-hydroxyacid dehydrogenase